MKNPQLGCLIPLPVGGCLSLLLYVVGAVIVLSLCSGLLA